jgi:general L-amino acid transport system substrate-binding protein
MSHQHQHEEDDDINSLPGSPHQDAGTTDPGPTPTTTSTGHSSSIDMTGSITGGGISLDGTTVSTLSADRHTFQLSAPQVPDDGDSDIDDETQQPSSHQGLTIPISSILATPTTSVSATDSNLQEVDSNGDDDDDDDDDYVNELQSPSQNGCENAVEIGDDDIEEEELVLTPPSQPKRKTSARSSKAWGDLMHGSNDVLKLYHSEASHDFSQDLGQDDSAMLSTQIYQPSKILERMKNWGGQGTTNLLVQQFHTTVSPPQQQQQEGTRSAQKSLLYCIGFTICILFAGVLIGIVVVLIVNTNGNDSAGGNATSSQTSPPPTPLPASTTNRTPTLRPTIIATATTDAPSTTTKPSSAPTHTAFLTTLEQVQFRNRLRCGVIERAGFAMTTNSTTGGGWTGMDVELCRAIAAAALGGTGISAASTMVDIIAVSSNDRFSALQSGDVDVLAGMTTVTMERDVYEPSTQVGFSFSTPYLYDGMGFGGIADYVECAQAKNATGTTCSALSICVVDGTKHMEYVQELLPEAGLVLRTTLAGSYTALINGECNVIASDQFSISERVVVVANDYTGDDYVVGSRFFSKEPIALVTRDNDAAFSDFVNWMVQALFYAEKQGIDQSGASSMGFNDVFGPLYNAAFANVVQAVGNYGELYQRHLEEIVSRQDVNRINDGSETSSSGLISSLPFGNMLTVGPGSSGTMAEISARGFLRCGITRRAVFAEFNRQTQRWEGMDIDLCRAVSAAIFDGVFSTIKYVELASTERFTALANEEIDLLSRISTITLERDVLEPSAAQGFSFSMPVFYDGWTFGGIPPYIQCANDLSTISGDSCQDMRICTADGSRVQELLAALFPERFLIPRESVQQAIEGLRTGDCNVVAGGTIDVSLRSVNESGYNGAYEVGTIKLASEPMALVTRQGDPQWSSFVYWIVNALFYAEEQGITQASSTRMPVVDLFGRLHFRIFRDVVAAVGSFEQIYRRNVESYVPRKGLNQLNTYPLGPQHYPYPGFKGSD